jgi:hypothetical protein
MLLFGIIVAFIIGMYSFLANKNTYPDTMRSGTADFNDDHPRAGVRVTSIGERPYFDPATLA